MYDLVLLKEFVTLKLTKLGTKNKFLEYFFLKLTKIFKIFLGIFSNFLFLLLK